MLLRLQVFLIAVAFIGLTHAYAFPVNEDLSDHILERDVLNVVFSYVDVETASKTHSVCKRWKSVADQNTDQKNITQNPYYYKTADLDVFFSHNNFPQEQLLAIFNNQNQNVTRRFWERLQYFGRVLCEKRKALTVFENTNFVRLLNLATFQKNPRFNPFSVQETHNIATFILTRRMTIKAWNDSIEKAEAYSALCTFSKNPDDHDITYELYMLLNPSQAAQILGTLASNDEVARIKVFYQRKVWNRAPRIEPQEPAIIRGLLALGSFISFLSRFF